MWILQLDKLKPGDVILEIGIPSVGAATNGPFGHASLALGGLAKIEADKEAGVLLVPFEFTAFRRGNERVVGIPVPHGQTMLVRRHRDVPDIGTLDGLTLLEAGRDYSVAKALALPDLKPKQRDRLQRLLAERGVTADAEGRTCSEIVARILGLPANNVSPNALATSTDLFDVVAAVADIGEGWVIDSTNTATSALDGMVAAIGLQLAKRMLDQAKLGVAAIRRGVATKEQIAENVEAMLDAELRESIRALQRIRELEPTVLHVNAEPI